MDTVEQLTQLCHDHALYLEHKGLGHYPIYNKENDVLVNYWPTSKNRTAHVRGASAGIRGVTPEQVVKLALGEKQ